MMSLSMYYYLLLLSNMLFITLYMLGCDQNIYLEKLLEETNKIEMSGYEKLILMLKLKFVHTMVKSLLL